MTTDDQGQKPEFSLTEASVSVTGTDAMTDEHTLSGSRETRIAIINGIKLSLSLVGTLVVAFAVRFMIPRYTGPAAFGQLNFAEAYAMSFFVFTSFGIDSYIRKEVSTRLEHANDFWAGFWLMRLGAAVIICILMAIGLHYMHKGAFEWRLAFIFALGQIAFVHNFTVTSLLHAASEVNELSFMNVISKILWGGGIWLSLYAGWAFEMVAVAFLVSESIKAVYLSGVTRRKLHLRWHVDMAATWAVVVASFPYFLNYMCHRTYEKLNVTMLSAMTNDSEVGWYAAATNIATISLLFLPILQAIIVPMAARTAKKSTESMNEIMRGAVRLVVVCGTFISLIIMLNAQTMVDHAFGSGFGESAISLRMLAPMFPLTYLAVLGAMHLIQLERIWTMIKVSVAALIINPLLNAPLIMFGFRMGPGWAGGMSAFASICTEGANAAITFYILGEAAVDGRLWRVLFKTLLICGIVSLVHLSLESWGAWRIPLETVLYFGLAMALGALPFSEIKQTINNAIASRRKNA
jgi:O-antigen/teichoic acid export membrane protein